MRIPLFDQVVALERGEAHELSHVVGNVCVSIFLKLQSEHPVPVPAGLMVALPALCRLTSRLVRLSQQELQHVGRPRLKPHKFRLGYDEMAALMLYVVPVATSAFVPLGKVQQKSLNLELFIDFSQRRV
jgi:hypothetical protein